VMTRTLAFALMLAAIATIAANAVHAQHENPWKAHYPHIEFGIDVGVMLWNGVDRDIVRPGGTSTKRKSSAILGTVADTINTVSPQASTDALACRSASPPRPTSRSASARATAFRVSSF